MYLLYIKSVEAEVRVDLKIGFVICVWQFVCVDQFLCVGDFVVYVYCVDKRMLLD